MVPLRSLIGLVFGVLLATGVASCAPGTPGEYQAVQDSARNITVTEKENGGQLDLHPGDALILKLESIPSTGYSWQISKNDARVTESMGKPEYERQDKKVMGGVEYQIFRFKALAKGTSTVELQYKRTWEKGKEPLKTYRIKVRID